MISVYCEHQDQQYLATLVEPSLEEQSCRWDVLGPSRFQGDSPHKLVSLVWFYSHEESKGPTSYLPRLRCQSNTFTSSVITFSLIVIQLPDTDL